MLSWRDIIIRAAPARWRFASSCRIVLWKFLIFDTISWSWQALGAAWFNHGCYVYQTMYCNWKEFFYKMEQFVFNVNGIYCPNSRDVYTRPARDKTHVWIFGNTPSEAWKHIPWFFLNDICVSIPTHSLFHPCANFGWILLWTRKTNFGRSVPFVSFILSKTSFLNPTVALSHAKCTWKARHIQTFCRTRVV